MVFLRGINRITTPGASQPRQPTCLLNAGALADYTRRGADSEVLSRVETRTHLVVIGTRSMAPRGRLLSPPDFDDPESGLGLKMQQDGLREAAEAEMLGDEGFIGHPDDERVRGLLERLDEPPFEAAVDETEVEDTAGGGER
jgi:hypothetical protein